jgi:hypothetical protein
MSRLEPLENSAQMDRHRTPLGLDLSIALLASLARNPDEVGYVFTNTVPKPRPLKKKYSKVPEPVLLFAWSSHSTDTQPSWPDTGEFVRFT